MRVAAWAAGMCLFLAACATPQTDAVRRDTGTLAKQALVSDAPFFAQRTKECGPASLAMALAASGVAVSPDDLVRTVYTPGRGGSLATDLTAGARRHGRLAYPIAGLRDLMRQVAAGTPVLVMQNLGLEMAPVWHFAVVIGYDIGAGTMTLHSGTKRALVMPMVTFERTWARADGWALAVLAPGKLPAQPGFGRYLDAATGLERAGQAAAAHAAYDAGLRQWPDRAALMMGAGNTLYEMRRLRDAAAMFARAAEANPRLGDAFNNLAHVRRALGETAAAERAARKAVALGGPHLATYRETLAAVLEQKAAENAGVSAR